MDERQDKFKRLSAEHRFRKSANDFLNFNFKSKKEKELKNKKKTVNYSEDGSYNKYEIKVKSV